MYSKLKISALEEENARLKENAEQLSLVIQNTGVGIWDWRVLSGEARFNEKWADIIGYTLDELSPVSIETWMKYAHPEDLEESKRRLQAHWQGESDWYEFESRMRHKNGHWVWVLDTGRVTEWEAPGVPKRMIGTHIDITEKKNAEVALLTERQKTIQQSKMASLGEMAASIAHEINNPLGIISGNAELIKIFRENNDWEKVAGALDVIDKNIQRISFIVKNLKRFSANSAHDQKEIISITKIVDGALSLVAPKLKQNRISLKLDLLENVKIFAIQIEIEQVFINLLNNAVDAIRHQDSPWVQIKGCIQDDGVTVYVIDSGPGISKAEAYNIFEPFYTSKSKENGTGLGLSICKNIMADCGGRIEVDTDQTNTSFVLKFPIAESA